MAGDTKSNQKTLEQRGFATLAMTYPEEMGIIAVAKDLSERTGEKISPDQVASLRNRLKAGSAYREALLQVEKADIRFKLKTLAEDLRELFDAASGESDLMRARAYSGHILAGVYKQLNESLTEEIQRVKTEAPGKEGDEQEADFTLVSDDEPLPAAAPSAPAPVAAAPVSPAPGATVQDPSADAASIPAPAPVAAAQDPDEEDTMNLLERVL